MDNLKIPLDGKDITIKLQHLSINDLVLDELNPRISFYRDNQADMVLNDDQIIYALTNKKPEAFRKLKDSIHNNKGIVYAIWVEPIPGSKFKVIEGNSRVVAYRQLSEEETSEDRWKSILSYILPNEVDEGQKNFIRLQSHLRGTTEWDAYEKAKYLYKLWQDDGWSKPKLEKQTKMTERQITENIEAYRLMEEQYLPKYGDEPNEVSKFSYFVEYVKDNKLKKLMEKNSKNISDFCDWVSDKNKIPTGQDVRKLKEILSSEETAQPFFENGFDSAIQILTLKKPYLTSSLYRDIENVIEGLKDINALELDEISSECNGEKEKMIRELLFWCQKIVTMIDKK